MTAQSREPRPALAGLLAAYDRAVLTQFAGARVLAPAALFALFTWGVFPALRAWAGPAAASGILPDMRLRWTVDEGYAALDALGEHGRLVYALSVAAADMFYPIVSALLLGALVSLAWQAAQPGRWNRRLARIPLVYLLADLSENAGLIAMLAAYPARLAGVAPMTALFTEIKWALVALCSMIIVAGAVGAAWRRIGGGRR